MNTNSQSSLSELNGLYPLGVDVSHVLVEKSESWELWRSTVRRPGLPTAERYSICRDGEIQATAMREETARLNFDAWSMKLRGQWYRWIPEQA
jgi:hypothetical protein